MPIEETWVQSLGGEEPLEEEMALLFLSGEFHGQSNLVGYSPWGHKESDTTEQQSVHTCAHTPSKVVVGLNGKIQPSNQGHRQQFSYKGES